MDFGSIESIPWAHMRYRGDWLNTNTYRDGDVVRHATGIFVWIAAAGIDQEPAGADDAYWSLLEPTTGPAEDPEIGLKWKGLWDAGVNYIEGDLVRAEYGTYVCVLANSAQSPPISSDDNTYWERIELADVRENVKTLTIGGTQATDDGALHVQTTLGTTIFDSNAVNGNQSNAPLDVAGQPTNAPTTVTPPLLVNALIAPTGWMTLLVDGTPRRIPTYAPPA